MSDRGKKAHANLKAHKEVAVPERYDMRCVQCAQGHRLCNRVKPCRNCVGAGRSAACRYPDKANRTTDEYKGRKSLGKNEDDEDEGENHDMATLNKRKNTEQTNQDEDLEDPEVQEAAMVVPMGSSPPEPVPPTDRRRKTQGWTVAMHFARAQVIHQAETMAADPTLGYVNPRIRPDLDPNFNVSIGPQPRVQRNNSLSGMGYQQNLTQEATGYMDDSQNNNQNAAQHLNDQSDINEISAGDLLDEIAARGSNNSQLGHEIGDFGEGQDFGNEVHEGFNVEFPAFTNNGLYTLVNASLDHPCNEYRSTGDECFNPCTFPCQEDHSQMTYNPHHVCHDCRVKPDLYDVTEEEEMIAKHRLYFCDECTRIRATGPAIQLWTHPRRAAEVKTRKVNKCSCHDELQKGWICEEHRMLKAEYIQKWGPEHVKSFRGFFGGDLCADCRLKPPQKNGAQVMWQCAHCKDIVLEE